MLERRLEPEVMDTQAEAADYDAMDHAAVNRAFAADFLATWDGGNPVLDVGTGTAQIPIELCRQDARPRVTAIDLAAEMLKIARDNVTAAGLLDRINIELVDAKGLPYTDGSFAAVISNSIIHHIPEPAAALAEMLRVCRPGGRIFVRDLLRPDTAAELNKLVEMHAAGANDHQKQMFSDSLHAALTLDEIRTLLAGLNAAPSTVRATSDRHWTWSGRR